MAKYLIWLLFLLGTNNVFAQSCYCTTSWHYNATYGQSYTANADCWACQQGAYNTSWQQAFCPTVYPAPQVCNTEVQFQTQSCPVNYSGIITQSRTKLCPQNVWSEWQTTSNTSVQNPPTCQITGQTQTLSCETGYTGSITQTRSSTCPNPYGQPVWQPWVTTSNTCKKSIDNPTNPVSPVNPASPVSPTSTTSAPTTQSSPATVSTPNTAPNSVATPTDSTTTTQETKPAETKTDAPTTTVSPITSTTPVTPTPPTPKGKTQSVVGLVLSLELYQKPGLTQGNVFPEVSIVQGIPNDILMHDKNLMSLIAQPDYNQPFEVPYLGFEQ